MIQKILLIFSCFVVLLLMWEWSAHTFPSLLFILPAPSKIFYAFRDMSDRFLFHTQVTLKEMCAGFLLALSFAFPLAWTMMRFRSSRSVLQPIFIVIQCLPMFTLAPIMVVWFGWGYTAIIIPTALMIFFPLTLNIYQGLMSTPKELIEFFLANQATSWQTFYKLRLPWALPHIFAGFRISSAIAGVSAIAGEWAGAQSGLGILMLESRRNSDLEITFAALFCLTTISMLLYGIILYCEKLTLPPRLWRFSFNKRRIKTTISNFKRKGFALSFFFLLALCIFFLGCQKKNNNSITRLLLDWLPNPNHVPLYVGLEKGFFKEMGIALSIQKMHEAGGGISYLTSKKADLFINHMPGTLKACEKGAELKIVGLLIKEPLSGFIYREDMSIKKAEDLSGKVFGYCIGGISDVDFLNVLLTQGKIIPKEKKNVSLDLVAALGTGNVDFIYGGFWNIEPAQLNALGIKTNTFKMQDLGIPLYYEMIILANADSFSASPEFVAKFQDALQKSINYCYAYPEESFNCFLKYNPDLSQKTSLWQKEAWKMTLPLLAKDQMIEKDLVKNFYLWQLAQGILKQEFDFEKLIHD